MKSITTFLKVPQLSTVNYKLFVNLNHLLSVHYFNLLCSLFVTEDLN